MYKRLLIMQASLWAFRIPGRRLMLVAGRRHPGRQVRRTTGSPTQTTVDPPAASYP